MKPSVLFNVEMVNFGRQIELRWVIRNRDGTEALPTEVIYTERAPDNMNALHMAPLSMSPDSAQSLMDELWRVGFRPSEGSGSAGSLAATERHLNDMRTIAMHQLQINQKAPA